MSGQVDRPSGWSKFFFYLHRANAILFLAVLVFIAALALIEMQRYQSYEFGSEFIESGFSTGADQIEGDIIETDNGQRVSYTIASTEEDDRDIAGANLSFTAMDSGKSRLVLPSPTDQLIFNWDRLASRNGGVQAYSVVVGSEEDFEGGVLDWIVGRFEDLEQATLARHVRYIDAPQMIDENTLSVIVWPTLESAEFWLVDLRDFSIISKRTVALPLPNRGNADPELELSAAESAEAAAEAAMEASR